MRDVTVALKQPKPASLADTGLCGQHPSIPTQFPGEGGVRESVFSCEEVLPTGHKVLHSLPQQLATAISRQTRSNGKKGRSITPPHQLQCYQPFPPDFLQKGCVKAHSLTARARSRQVRVFREEFYQLKRKSAHLIRDTNK